MMELHLHFSPRHHGAGFNYLSRGTNLPPFWWQKQYVNRSFGRVWFCFTGFFFVFRSFGFESYFFPPGLSLEKGLHQL
jgi:hypothetical protein